MKSIYLMPGEIHFGNDVDEIKTLLGSCVGVTLWHPIKKLGGMCHIVLPGKSIDEQNPRYAYGAINIFKKKLATHNTKPNEYTVCIYGGGNMFSVGDKEEEKKIGHINVTKTRELLRQAGFSIKKTDVLGSVYRHITMNMHTGVVQLKTTPVSETMA